VSADDLRPRSRTTSSEAPPPDPMALATHAASLVQSNTGYKELPGQDQRDVLVNLSEVGCWATGLTT
jgi:hypothetical protein